MSTNIICKAKKYNQIYVSACGNVSLLLARRGMDASQSTKNGLYEKINKFQLYKQSLKEISTVIFSRHRKHLGNNVLGECSRQCGEFDKLGAQFEN